jgi:conjugative relaxase-like TrwC/TraI family protein
VRAVAGFDSTFSAPKSLSVWWALIGDPGLLAAHDVAVTAALEYLERFGATTRVRADGRRQHPDAVGLTMATFRQTTSRADDPQVHTHAVISTKVQTDDGRWLALDARYLKRYQRMLGGLYQSVLRAELTHRYGVAWEPIVNGQAEIAGVPRELLEVFSKRAAQVDTALAAKVGEFRRQEGRDPTAWERAALTREASADTRTHKSGHGVADLRTRWLDEAADVGWTPKQLTDVIQAGAAHTGPGSAATVTLDTVVDALSATGSTWNRADVVRVICNLQPPVSPLSGPRWAATLERAADRVIEACVDLDPPDPSTRRASDGRSVWLEPTAPHFTSDVILAEERGILTWATDAQADEPTPSTTVVRAGLDVLQADAAAAVAGGDRLVLLVGPAGAGKTTALERAVDDLASWDRPAFGVAPSAKAAHVLREATGIETDTVAKLLHEWHRGDRPPLDRYRLPAGTTVIADEAGMLGTSSLHRLVNLTDQHGWRLALVGDPHQLQAVGRGGLFGELCATGRVHELTRLHRFTHPWEATTSLQLRAGNPHALDEYQAHGRIVAGPLETHVDRIARDWLGHTLDRRTVAIMATSNDHVDALNHAIQQLRLTVGQLRSDRPVEIGNGEVVYPGDVVATRRNERDLRTSTGEPVRNRDRWDVLAVHRDGSLTLSHRSGHGTVTLPGDYVHHHVRLGYAATEHGAQGDTVDIAIELVSPATTHRGLYVGATRGRDENHLYVITDTSDPTDARDVLDAVLAHDRADVPAVTQHRHLAHDHIVSPRRPAASSILPDWIGPWRRQLEQRRHELADGLAAHANGRARATVEWHALQPALVAARAAWQPYGDALGAIDEHLRRELRPALWNANNEAARAGFGHHRATTRRARTANAAIAEAETDIAALRAQGAPVKEHLDHLELEARQLDAAAHPSPAGSALDDLDRQAIHTIDRALDAVAVLETWAHGRPVARHDLTTALATLTEIASASIDPLGTGDQHRPEWADLVDSVSELIGASLAPKRDTQELTHSLEDADLSPNL